jgi:hypothetical protein
MSGGAAPQSRHRQMNGRVSELPGGPGVAHRKRPAPRQGFAGEPRVPINRLSRANSGRGTSGSSSALTNYRREPAHANEPVPGKSPESSYGFANASTKNWRDLVDLTRRAVTSFCAAEASHAFALAMSSKAIITNRFGGVPSVATMFSVRTMKWPKEATAGAAVDITFLNVSGSVTSLMSMTA